MRISISSVPATPSTDTSSPSHHPSTAPVMSEYADSDNDSDGEGEQKVSI